MRRNQLHVHRHQSPVTTSSYNTRSRCLVVGQSRNISNPIQSSLLKHSLQQTCMQHDNNNARQIVVNQIVVTKQTSRHAAVQAHQHQVHIKHSVNTAGAVSSAARLVSVSCRKGMITGVERYVKTEFHPSDETNRYCEIWRFCIRCLDVYS